MVGWASLYEPLDALGSAWIPVIDVNMKFQVYHDPFQEK